MTNTTTLQPFITSLLPLELIQLNQQIVDILQSLDLVQPLETVQQCDP